MMENDNSILKNLEKDFLEPELEDWEKIAEKSLKGKPLNKLYKTGYDGIKIKPLYSANEQSDVKHYRSEFPGIPKYKRGTDYTGYKTKPWLITQQIYAANADEFNSKVKKYLLIGQTAITIDVHENETFPPNDLNDYEKAFEGINLKEIPLNLFAGVKSINQLQLIDNYLEHIDLDWMEISGGIDSDIIAELVKTGFLENEVDNYLAQILPYFSKASDSEFKLFSICSIPYREGGANVIQELAFTLSTAVYYIRYYLNNGLMIDEIAHKMRFVLTTGSDFFVEISKIRAMRMLWATVINDFGGSEESQKLNLYMKSLEMNKSGLDVWVNLLRNSTETLSSVIGGCNTLELINFDYSVLKNKIQKNLSSDKLKMTDSEKLRMTDNDMPLMNNDELEKSIEFSERVARNTQIVLSEECNLREVIDPAGGSYFIEYLTEEIAKKSWDLFREVEKLGGILEALKAGFPQEEVRKIRDERIKNLSTRKEVILGVNKYPNINEELIALSQTYNATKVDREVDGVVLVEAIPKFRVSEMFEELRLKSVEFKNKTGATPKVFIAAFGPLSKHKAKVEFTLDFLHTGGIEAEYKGEFNSFEDAAKSFLSSSLSVIVICSSDSLYPEFVPQLARLIKRAKPLTKIILAGYSTEHIAEFSEAGVDEFIHVKSDVIKILNELFSSFLA